MQSVRSDNGKNYYSSTRHIFGMVSCTSSCGPTATLSETENKYLVHKSVIINISEARPARINSVVKDPKGSDP